MNFHVRIVFTMILFFLPFVCQGAQEKTRKTVCLNMIVKNESQVITRCLDSMLPIIDTWVIVDTGSTDGTQQIIKDHMKSKGIPGELYERPWVNFSHNRNEALRLAKGKADYVFFIDADEYLMYDPDFKLPDLDKDYYYVTIAYSGTRYGKIQMVNNHLDWEYVGVLHEVIAPPVSRSHGSLEKVVNIYTTEGARSKDPQKYLKDAAILEAGLKDEPNNARYVFYLAQSYRDAGNHAKALENYERYVKMGDWDQEVFWSLMQIASMQQSLGKPQEEVLASYYKAFLYRSSRIEPLYHIANMYREKGDFESGYQVAKMATMIPQTKDGLFVQQWMSDYGIPLELSVCAYWLGKYEECQQISLELLKRNDLPPNFRSCIEGNLGFSNAKILEKICSTVLDEASEAK